MTTKEVCDYVDELLKDGPLRGSQLITKIVEKFYEKLTPESDAVDILNIMVQENKIIELEYVQKNMDYRIKSMYFHRQTKIRVINFLELK